MDELPTNTAHVTRSFFLDHPLKTPKAAVFLGIWGEAVPPACPNPDPVPDKKSQFPHLFFDLASKSLPVFRPGVDRNYVIIT